MKTLQDIADWLRQERAHRGWSQAELARIARIPVRSYQRLEAGDPGARLATALRACAALGLELASAVTRRPTLDELPTLYGEREGNER